MYLTDRQRLLVFMSIMLTCEYTHTHAGITLSRHRENMKGYATNLLLLISVKYDTLVKHDCLLHNGHEVI